MQAWINTLRLTTHVVFTSLRPAKASKTPLLLHMGHRDGAEPLPNVLRVDVQERPRDADPVEDGKVRLDARTHKLMGAVIVQCSIWVSRAKEHARASTQSPSASLPKPTL